MKLIRRCLIVVCSIGIDDKNNPRPIVDAIGRGLTQAVVVPACIVPALNASNDQIFYLKLAGDDRLSRSRTIGDYFCERGNGLITSQGPGMIIFLTNQRVAIDTLRKFLFAAFKRLVDSDD